MRPSALFTILFCVLLVGAHAQESESKSKFRAGLKAGMNTSQMTGDGYSGFFKFSPVVGVYGNYIINEKSKIQYELIYQQKGSHKPSVPDKGVYDSYKISLDYIELPLLYQYQFNRFEIEAGPGFSVLVNSKISNQFGELPAGTDPFTWRSFELDAIIGMNFYFKPEHFFVNFRAHHSVTSVVTTTAVTPYGTFGGAWNIVLAISLNYTF